MLAYRTSPQSLGRNRDALYAGRSTKRALDLGCAVGRASFELARHFDHVDGVDFSARFINLGVQLNNEGVLRYAITDEGDLQLFKTRSLAELAGACT